MNQFSAKTLLQLRGYGRQNGKILVANPYEFIMLCDNLEDAQAAVDKFANAAVGVVGYGEATQVRFTPR